MGSERTLGGGALKGSSKLFEVSGPLKEAVEPKERGEVGMYLGGTWYDLKLKAGVRPDDPVKGLDVSVLQENSWLRSWNRRPETVSASSLWGGPAA